MQSHSVNRLRLGHSPALVVTLVLVSFAHQARAGNQKDQLEDITTWFAPRTVFVTPIVYNGHLGGLAGADEICNNHAQASGSIVPEGNYVAILSDTEKSAASRVGVSMGPIVNSIGEPVAENVTALFSGIVKRFRSRPDPDDFTARYIWFDDGSPLSSPINRTAAGDLAPGAAATWTGSLTNGQPASNDPAELCSGWTTANAGKTGKGVGLPQLRSAGWITGEEVTGTIDFGCDQPRGLYCLQRID